jgi:hypothetical protein
MKKTIALMFLVAIALIAVPVSQASGVTRPSWSIDGTTPPVDPPPWGVVGVA